MAHEVLNTVVESKAGEQFIFIWEHLNQKCPFIHLSDPKLIKGFVDYCGMDNDLRRARECFEQLNKSEAGDHTLSNSLLANGVMTYGRAFAESKVRSASLDFKQVFKGVESFKTTHMWLIGLRNEFFAHASGSEYETIKIYLALHPDLKTGPLEVYRGIIGASSFEYDRNRDAIATINHALDWLKVKIDKSYVRLRELLWKESPAELYARAMLPDQLSPEIRQFVSSKN